MIILFVTNVILVGGGPIVIMMVVDVIRNIIVFMLIEMIRIMIGISVFGLCLTMQRMTEFLGLAPVFFQRQIEHWERWLAGDFFDDVQEFWQTFHQTLTIQWWVGLEENQSFASVINIRQGGQLISIFLGYHNWLA